MKLLEALEWRYAVKKYKDSRVDDNKLERILAATNLSASSVGIQPYRVLVIQDQELKQQLGAGSFNTQIAESSHLLIFAAYTDITQGMIDDFMSRTASTRSLQTGDLADFKSKLEMYLLNRTPQENFEWATRQAYIALGTALIAAATEQVDSTPMEGFDSAHIDQILGLGDKGLKSVVLLALGYRDEEQDWLASLPKVRLDVKDFAPVVHHESI